MFFVAAGFVLGAPVVLNTLNRVLEEVIIPNQEMRKIKKRRAQQAAAGVPEEERETTQRVRIQGIMRIDATDRPIECDVEITEEEYGRLRDAGIHDILRRGINRRPHIERAEEEQRAQA